MEKTLTYKIYKDIFYSNKNTVFFSILLFLFLGQCGFSQIFVKDSTKFKISDHTVFVSKEIFSTNLKYDSSEKNNKIFIKKGTSFVGKVNAEIVFIDSSSSKNFAKVKHPKEAKIKTKEPNLKVEPEKEKKLTKKVIIVPNNTSSNFFGGLKDTLISVPTVYQFLKSFNKEVINNLSVFNSICEKKKIRNKDILVSSKIDKSVSTNRGPPAVTDFFV